MHLSHPWFLWFLLLLPPIVLLALARERFSRRLRQTFSAPPNAAWRWRSGVRLLTGGLVPLLVIGALSGPQWWTMQKDDPRRHRQLAIGIDVSKSMLAEDVPPTTDLSLFAPVINRLNAARWVALQLVEELAGEQAALFFFARNGIEAVAPTRDQGFLRYMVLHTRLAELTESGSDLGAAMRTGATLLGDGDGGTAGAVILITDGEDTENTLQQLTGQAREMAAERRPVFTIGIGRPEEVYIPIRRPGTRGIDGFYSDREGRHLQTRMEAATLQVIAGGSGGSYYALQEETARNLARRLLEAIPASTGEEEAPPRHRALADLAPLLVAFGLILYTGHCLL